MMNSSSILLLKARVLEGNYTARARVDSDISALDLSALPALLIR